MTKKLGNISSNQGTSILTRKQEPLDANYFGIDERSLSELMAFTAAFSQKVQYVERNNKIEGDWSPFFENDLAFVLAEIACTDINELSEKFKKEVQLSSNNIDETEEREILMLLIDHTTEIFQLINNWYTRAKSDIVHLEENKLVEQLKNAIELQLRPQLKTFQLLCLRIKEASSFDQTILFNFEYFDQIWHNESKSKSGRSTVANLPFTFNRAVGQVHKIHKITLGVIIYLKGIAPDLLQYALEHFPYHSPHTSLFLSFLKTFRYVQDDMNKIVHRHLDYYYSTILKQSLRSSSPDHAHVYFVPSEHIIRSVIPRGTVLTAGTDEDGLDYTYLTDNSVELNQGVITDLKVVHVSTNPQIGLGGPYQSVSNIYARTVNIDGNGFALDDSNNPISFDTFGKDQSDINYANRTMDQAPIGFALSSSILLLTEGERKINIKYKFSLKSMSSLILFIEEMTKSKHQKGEKGTTNKNRETHALAIEEEVLLSPQSAFYKILADVFKVRITTQTGWFETERYEILPPKSWTTGEISINLVLDISAPPVAAYDEEIHGEGFSTAWPVFEFVLTSEKAMYAYSYLRDLTIEMCTIDVEVSQVKGLQVFNDLGKLDINKPFYPFGSTPDLGSYFLIGNEELFRKTLTDLSFDIHWHNLPQTKGGFESHYKSYNKNVGTSDFTVGLTSLSEFQFHPLNRENAQQVSIFSKHKKGDVLNDKLRITELELDKLEINPNYLEMDLEDYNSQTRSGFLKFEVTGPAMAFGHSDYPRLFAEAIVENAKLTSGLIPTGSKKKIEIPNEPYIPQIRTISMNYSATTSIKMSQTEVSENDKKAKDQIYHIHPFGKLVVFDNGLPTKKHLVPQFNNEGYLVIGLEKLQPPMSLSIYFELEDNIENDFSHIEIPQTKWRYLVNNSWVDFEESEFIFDGTNNFVTSGVVQLKLPSTINTTHDIVASGKYWISVLAPNNTHLLSKISLVQTNGVRATWHAHKPDEEWKHNIEKDTISGLAVTRTDVTEVFQPFPSYGGRLKENANEFYIRVSERLKHKNRCIIPEDYEKILLNQFPFLFQVKCITHFSNPDFVSRGHVKVIVVPKLKTLNAFYGPKIDYDELDRITQFVENAISPFVEIEVINPVYEKVRVNCKIRLQNNEKSGEFVRKIETDLRRYICPWFNENQQEMNFGGSIERDDILSFLESLGYVRFVTKLSVVVLHNSEGKYSLSDSASDEGKNNVLTCTSPWSVLISDTHHEVDLIDKSINEAPEETRIDTMKIGTDFVIVEEDSNELDFSVFDLDNDTYYTIDIDL